MKRFVFHFLIFSTFTFGQKVERSQLIIPPKQIVQVDYPLYKGFNVKIWNKSKFDVGVSARERKTDSLRKGFGLEKGSNAVLEVNQGLYLQFENRYLAPIKVEYALVKGLGEKEKTRTPLTPQRTFYLENNTAQSLPLSIPGVVSPKLSPFSRSGVNLPNGQKIYLNFKGDKILILTVTDSIAHGTRIDVAYLIEKAMNKK